MTYNGGVTDEPRKPVAVIETAAFRREATRLAAEDDIAAIIDFLAWNPEAGVLIPGAGGARKARHPGRGRGKSGGYRTVHYFYDEDTPLYLFTIYAKGEKDTLTKAETNELRDICRGIASAERSKS